MAFQTEVRFDQGYGVVGELNVDGPVRAQSVVIHSENPANNVVGRYFTRNADGTYGAGGVGAAGGILANPKVYASQGATDTLSPTLTLRNGELGEFVSLGEINILIDVAADPGADVQYNTTTGALTAVAAGTAPAEGFAAAPGAKLARVAQADASGGLAVVALGSGATTYNIITE
ncbi:MAG: hypothetical protein LBJ59_02635 [Zoogloeaceae bacterium]|jgi:hypothetical protein|nr:hypothetical protein [Zoogloeaceae bacterium]